MDTNWQPIETAPKDGPPILVWDKQKNEVMLVKWQQIDIFSTRFEWCVVHSEQDYGPRYWAIKCTHWMPLPQPPTE